MPPPRARRSQAERHAETHAALIAAGRELFGEHGVAAVSAEQIVAAAGVTRGALYHHFRDKNDLFEAVFRQMEEELCAELTPVIEAAGTAVEGLAVSIGTFLDACGRPDVRRIALSDAPSVLGWARWREIEYGYALGVITERLRVAAGEGARLVGPAEVLSPLLYSSACEAALSIAASDEPEAARARIEPVLLMIFAGAVGLTP